MDAATLAAGKGKRVEFDMYGTITQGTLMGQQRNKSIISFYVRLDNGQKGLIAARRILRFVD